MARNILLYGATGYSGRLIAAELKQYRDAHPNDYVIVLAGRHAARLRKMAEALDMDFRVFELGDEAAMASALADADVVVNAAGPCAWTAPRLAKAALQAKCSYVDINGEPDVYLRLRADCAVCASNRNRVIVCGAGFWAAASNLLLDQALSRLEAAGVAITELGSIRIGMSRIQTFSRGSAETVLRSLRQQVLIVRKGRDADGNDTMLPWPQPIGKLERSFDFSPARTPKPDRRIASCASLVDTLAAQHVVFKHKALAGTIESYVEAGTAARIAYQAGSVLSPLTALTALRDAGRRPLELLAEGPTPQERENEPHRIVLEIELPGRSRVVDWLWHTPNVYQFTAQLVSAVAGQVAAGNPPLKGWVSPAVALRPLALPLTAVLGATRGCTLHDRSPA